MSEPKFTPGPWKAVRHGEDIYTWTIQGNDEFEERSLAFVGVGTPNLKRDMANMHLIKAAPEMYDALADATRHYCSICRNEPIEIENLVKNGCPKTRYKNRAYVVSCVALDWLELLRKARGEA